MPAAVAVPLIGTAVTAGMSGLQMAQANKEKNKIQQDINNFKRQDLVNPFAGLQVSTLGADRQREDMARTLASYGQLAAMGGSRGIAATLPNLLEQQNAQEAQIAANLDQQQMQINQLQGQGEFYKTKMQEERDTAELAGLGTRLDLANAQSAAAKNSMMGGIAGGLNNVASAGLASMADGNGFFGPGKPKLITTGAMAGFQPGTIDMSKLLQNNIPFGALPKL